MIATKQTPRSYLVEQYGFTEEQAFNAFECMFYQWEKFRMGGYVFVRRKTDSDVNDGRLDTIGHVNYPYAIYQYGKLGVVR